MAVRTVYDSAAFRYGVRCYPTPPVLLAVVGRQVFDKEVRIQELHHRTLPQDAPDLSRFGIILTHYIERGGHGTVYLGKKDGRTVLVKQPAGAYFVSHFLREIALLEEIKHRAVVTSLFSGKFNESPFLVTEYLDGKSLTSILLDHHFSIKLSLLVAAEICAGLSAVHACGVMHRDIKPDNIMMLRSGQLLKIIDFGISQKVAAPKNSGGYGTACYAAPEQLGGICHDLRSDIYSVGVVLFQMLAHTLPRMENDIGNLLKLHKTTPVPSPAKFRSMPKPVEEITMIAMAPNPNDRFNSAAHMHVALANAISYLKL